MRDSRPDRRPTLVPRRVDHADGSVDFDFDLVGPDGALVSPESSPRRKLRLDWPEPAPEPPPKTCRVCGDAYDHWIDGPFCPACGARTQHAGYKPDVDYELLTKLHDARIALCHLTDLIQSLRPRRTRPRRR